jgi:hypothetical protein
MLLAAGTLAPVSVNLLRRYGYFREIGGWGGVKLAKQVWQFLC